MRLQNVTKNEGFAIHTSFHNDSYWQPMVVKHLPTVLKTKRKKNPLKKPIERKVWIAKSSYSINYDQLIENKETEATAVEQWEVSFFVIYFKGTGTYGKESFFYIILGLINNGHHLKQKWLKPKATTCSLLDVDSWHLA